MALYSVLLLEAAKPNVMACSNVSPSGVMSTTPMPTSFVLEAPSTKSFQVSSGSFFSFVGWLIGSGVNLARKSVRTCHFRAVWG